LKCLRKLLGISGFGKIKITPKSEKMDEQKFNTDRPREYNKKRKGEEKSSPKVIRDWSSLYELQSFFVGKCRKSAMKKV